MANGKKPLSAAQKRHLKKLAELNRKRGKERRAGKTRKANPEQMMIGGVAIMPALMTAGGAAGGLFLGSYVLEWTAGLTNRFTGMVRGVVNLALGTGIVMVARYMGDKYGDTDVPVMAIGIGVAAPFMVSALADFNLVGDAQRQAIAGYLPTEAAGSAAPAPGMGNLQRMPYNEVSGPPGGGMGALQELPYYEDVVDMAGYGRFGRRKAQSRMLAA